MDHLDTLIKNVKDYFRRKKENGKEPSSTAPDGFCPNCWGEQEWDGHFFELMSARNITPDSATYNNFIKEFVTKHVSGITIPEYNYVCTTCRLSFNPSDKE